MVKLEEGGRVLKNLFNENTVDAWISGLGSFLGALLAGLISSGVAVWIMYRQIKHQEKIIKQQVFKESMNNYKKLVSNTIILLDFLDAIRSSINFLDRAIYETHTNTIKDIKERGEEIKRIILDFDRINESLIDRDVIDQYLELRKTNIYVINLINITNGNGNKEINKRISEYIKFYNKTKEVFTEKLKNFEEIKE